MRVDTNSIVKEKIKVQLEKGAIKELVNNNSQKVLEDSLYYALIERDERARGGQKLDVFQYS